MRRRAWLAPLLPAVLATCAGVTDPGLVSLTGCWNEIGSVPGSALVLQLTDDQRTINGTGHFAIEAGASGNLTVTGTRTGSQLDLDLFYDIGTHRSFLAIVRSKDSFDAYERDQQQNLATTPISFQRCK